MSELEKRQTVVVVGGGGAGAQIVHSLSGKLDRAKYELILVTVRPFYVHLPACIRMTVTDKGKLEDRALIPYDHSFVKGNGKLVVGTVVSIQSDGDKGGSVILANGNKINYSVLVLTPGSKWEGPVALPDTKEECLQWIRDWRQKFENANNTTVVGGGAAGIKFAEEITDQWPRYGPFEIHHSKEVTLIHAEELLLNHVYSRGWRKGLARRLRKRGVNVLLNEQVEDLTPQNGSVTTKNGKTVPTDLVVSVRHTFHSTLVIGCFTNIPCRGGRPNTEFVASLGPGALVESNRVKVTPTLQLFHYPHVLASGGVIDWYEQKQVAKYGTQRLHDHQKRDCPLGEKISTSDLYWKV
ncbi:hypothetical protein BDQ12DRAFT_759587 [Crucibulum laeve]|uniref:FAD/NAD(P)-binding domain-containing protein n=1 Tax=Crucibulum laeve TaxID=68775 RepID=A0A5C3LTX4_9AGAR|nr:hypothetical protein BDQ12DRAFT_759587 [Crucibulum laeve]